MFDQTSTPAQKPRRLLLIVLSLIAVMIIMLMLWRNFANLPSVKWSVLLENISKGDVAKISVGPESAKVTAAKKAGGHEYHVSYLNARFGEAGPKELNEEIRAYNLTAKEKNVLPIETVSAEPASALSQILPPLLGLGLLIWAFYFFVLRRMGHGDGTMPFGKNREPFNSSEFETGENRRSQSWFSRWQQRRATRARESQEREESEEQLILDRLLVKVSEQGLPSLTAAERSSLQRISRKQKERQETGV